MRTTRDCYQTADSLNYLGKKKKKIAAPIDLIGECPLPNKTASMSSTHELESAPLFSSR